jgi:hypothetical protein
MMMRYPNPRMFHYLNQTVQLKMVYYQIFWNPLLHR